jgi:hypothetical protein
LAPHAREGPALENRYKFSAKLGAVVGNCVVGVRPVLAEIYFLRAETLLRMMAQEEASARVVPITLPAARDEALYPLWCHLSRARLRVVP